MKNTFLILGGTFIVSVCSSEVTDGDCDLSVPSKVGCVGIYIDTPLADAATAPDRIRTKSPNPGGACMTDCGGSSSSDLGLFPK
jgi:hypothetical protein